MLSLAFECAGQGLSLALAEEGELLASLKLDMDRGQPAALMPAIAQGFEQAGRPPSELKRIGVSRGPGGFTGIRLGLSVALGLARSTKAKLYGFNAFDLYARQAATTKNLSLVIESRRAELFARLYGPEGQVVFEDAILGKEAFIARCHRSNLAGSGVSHIVETQENTEPDMKALALYLSLADAGDLKEQEGATTPLYLREPEIGTAKKP